ncbi:MAG: GH3 auxin-responsive promoter family protein [Bacteroidales bacterium]|nr:GH3 auxin-responsive promoter family protein [Bacteroidales bacterium]MBK9358744.1 GH3 auxin-responsive promoter family protein [Bacteroidales bacterium]
MTLINSVISWFMKKRMHQIELFMKYPQDVQDEWFKKLILAGRGTEWGKKYDYASINNYSDFVSRVPVNDYNDLKPYIDRLRNGEQNLLWNSEIKWFAKSSGTTSDKSKFIPVSEEALDECHFKGGKDLLSIYCNNNPDTQIFSGRLLGMGGTHFPDNPDAGTFVGDVSAIIMENLPTWVELIRTPDLSIALMSEWESKIEKIAQITRLENVTNITGVPSWTMVLLKRVLEITGKDNIKEVWPNLELFIHGGVSFSPYQNQFSQLIPGPMNYLETYNASEGFFGIQDRNDADDMLLMLDYGIFYEFLPLNIHGQHESVAIPLQQVKTGVNYAMIISTNAGLWRYQIGDTIAFTSTEPYRIRITGRTKNFINAFGEELIVDNALKALESACEKTGAMINEFTAAPVYFSDNASGAHEWLIEFEKEPADLAYFSEMLDNALKALNSDYEAKRYHNMVLNQPVIRTLPAGTFYNWLKKRDKLGGQFKVPRLSNNRNYVDEILEVAQF